MRRELRVYHIMYMLPACKAVCWRNTFGDANGAENELFCSASPQLCSVSLRELVPLLLTLLRALTCSRIHLSVSKCSPEPRSSFVPGQSLLHLRN